MLPKRNKYKDAGVDIQAGEEALSRIKPLVRQTFNTNVISDIGSFGGLYHFDCKNLREPILVASTDGVGTKLLVAKMANKFDTIGRDLVNHCVNDILVQGAFPLFFLDYIGTGHIEIERVEEIVKGLVIACKENNTSLIGGETAEMPGIYHKDDFDLVGTIVGFVEKENIIDGTEITEGDLIIGFPSTGLHTNGYSLARKVFFKKLHLNIDSIIPDIGMTVAESLLTVHKSYLAELSPLIQTRKIKGMAHITGGGIPGNLKRIIPDGLCAKIELNTWDPPEIFKVIQKAGAVDTEEMFEVFNMGIGLIAVVDRDSCDTILEKCNAIQMGTIVKGKDKVLLVPRKNV
jgi:phosphoribosylformylglycinamidine cyclo-ligase